MGHLINSQNFHKLFFRNIHELIANDLQGFLVIIMNHPAAFNELFQYVLNSKCPNRCSITTIDQEAAPSVHSTIHQSLENLYGTMEFSDVVFVIEGKNLKAHKNILSCK